MDESRAKKRRGTVTPRPDRVGAGAGAEKRVISDQEARKDNAPLAQTARGKEAQRVRRGSRSREEVEELKVERERKAREISRCADSARNDRAWLCAEQEEAYAEDTESTEFTEKSGEEKGSTQR